MKKTEGIFEKLSREKQERIIHACIDEFAEVGYDMASTNRIAKKAGIAKGSIFKYFGNKEHMFRHIVEHAFDHFITRMSSKMHDLPPDILDRFVAMQMEACEWEKEEPRLFKLFMKLSRAGGGMQLKTRAALENKIKPVMAMFFHGLDTSNLRFKQEEIGELLLLIDSALDNEMAMKADDTMTPAKMIGFYKRKMEIVYKALKYGIYK